jgi:hypothetical protein
VRDPRLILDAPDGIRDRREAEQRRKFTQHFAGLEERVGEVTANECAIDVVVEGMSGNSEPADAGRDDAGGGGSGGTDSFGERGRELSVFAPTMPGMPSDSGSPGNTMSVSRARWRFDGRSSSWSSMIGFSG